MTLSSLPIAVTRERVLPFIAIAAAPRRMYLSTLTR